MDSDRPGMLIRRKLMELLAAMARRSAPLKLACQALDEFDRGSSAQVVCGLTAWG
jgi:hypothetical protein